MYIKGTDLGNHKILEREGIFVSFSSYPQMVEETVSEKEDDFPGHIAN